MIVLPPNVKLIGECSSSDEYIIERDETHIFPFIIYGNKYTRLDIAHNFNEKSVESFTINIWFSQNPIGDFLYNLPINLRNFHPSYRARSFIFYPSKLDFTRETTKFHDALFDCHFDEEYREHRKQREFENTHTARFEQEGTYYINIKNLISRTNGYFLKISRHEFI